MRVLLRAGGGEADQGEGGVKTSLIVSTLQYMPVVTGMLISLTFKMDFYMKKQI